MTRLSCSGPVLATALASALSWPVTAAGSTPAWAWPLEPVPHVVRPFQPPASPYGPGHRGVDLSGTVGQPVLSVAPGTVSFAGSVAGHGVVVIDHGELSSTYQPVSSYVTRGAKVTAGHPVGSLELIGSHCLPDACLHLGAKRGDAYLDPLDLLPGRPVRLKPLAGLPPDGLDGVPRWQTRPPPWGRLGRGLDRPTDTRCGGGRGATVGLSAGRGRGPPAGQQPPAAPGQALGWA